MKKQAVLTAVASLLTLASVAVLPAFAQETGGTNFNSNKRPEQSWQHRGDREQQGKDMHSQYGYGYNRSGQYGYGQDRQGKDMHSQYDYGYNRSDKDRHGKDSSKSYGYGYNRSGKGNSGSGYGSGYGYGYSSPTMSR